MFNQMEKLITKRSLYLTGIVSFIIVLAIYFLIQSNNAEEEKLFDIFFADLYNEEEINIDEKLYYLSSLDKPNVSFFSDLKLTSIENLDRYNKIDKDILLLKKALIDLDEDMIKTLSLDENFTFNEIAKIYLYNININNYEISASDNDNLNNFFIKAIDRLSNEKN